MIQKGQLITPALKFRVDTGRYFSHLTTFSFDFCGPASTRIACRRYIHFYMLTLDLAYNIIYGGSQHQIKKNDRVYQGTRDSYIYWPNEMRKDPSCLRLN